MQKSSISKSELESLAIKLSKVLRDYENANRSLEVIESGVTVQGLHGTLEEVNFAITYFCIEAQKLTKQLNVEQYEILKSENLLSGNQLQKLAEMPKVESSSLNEGNENKTQSNKGINNSPNMS